MPVKTCLKTPKCVQMNTVAVQPFFHSYDPFLCPLEVMSIPQNDMSHPVK